MSDLKNWSQKMNRYMVIRDGETWEGIYGGYRLSMSTYDPKIETVSYLLEGKIWNSASKALAAQMSDVPKGCKLKISRMGKGSNTKYNVEILSVPEEKEDDNSCDG